MIPTLITVLLVKAGTPLETPPHPHDPLELLNYSSDACGFLTSCRTVFDTGTKKYVAEEDLPNVLPHDFIGIDSVESIQSMVSPPSSPFLPDWWDSVGWDDISEDDMFELYEVAKRLVAAMAEKEKDSPHFTVQFIGFWQVDSSRDFESQIDDVDAVRFAGVGEAVFKG